MLETKLKKLDESLQALGLSKDELFVHLLREKGFSLEDLNGLKKQAKSETYVAVQGWRDYPIINPNFGGNDIRSRVQVGWYAFAGGHFSADKNAYPNCQGVIGIINDDPDTEEGYRVKVVLRHQGKLEWCEKIIYTGVADVNNGKENTRRLLEYGKKKGIKFPTMEFAQGYTFDGVKPGEAYVPAVNELEELSDNFKAIDDALEQVGSTFNDYYWSSSELSYSNAWTVRSSDGYAYNLSLNKDTSYAVSCLLAY